jgi:hypothetical protein
LDPGHIPSASRYVRSPEPSLADCRDKLLPPCLPQLLADILHGHWHGPIELDQ